ncbi:S8 family serine peptidase, partial [Staphylococcus aureus]|nr:S8 family serine peptidase [Staphylococcus aureus]
DWISAADAASFPTLCGSQSNSSWHGTFVTGQIAAQRNNGIGIAGIAPGVRVQMARALGKSGGVTSDIMDAMTWLAGGAVPGVISN